jgi:hypothetical protein
MIGAPPRYVLWAINAGSPGQLEDGAVDTDVGCAEPRPIIVTDVVSRGGEKQADAAFSTKCPNRIVLKRLLDAQWWFGSSQRAAPGPSYIPSL